MTPTALDPHRFASSPLDMQISALRAAYTPDNGEALLRLCGSCRDHGPLAWMCAHLYVQGWLEDKQHRTVFAAFLIEQPETAVDQVVKSFVGVMAEGSEQPQAALGLALGLALWEAVEAAPLEKLATICLLDRALKRHFSDLHTEAGTALEARATAHLTQGNAAQEMPLAWGARLSARAIERLEKIDPQNVRVWYQAVAERAIQVLGDAPKALSQANAEVLLSRRVYADPGHFLIELLQNAEDSGAQHWRVAFTPDWLQIWHDGTPFDVRDLVGVCSIGQTTKRKQQIGFFGVGFKSVFEITDRPQVFSGVFQFEVADVSIPKQLTDLPPGTPLIGTTLRLPLRAPRDPVRSAHALFDRATKLDPCVLLALRHIHTIDLAFLSETPNSSLSYHLHRRPGPTPNEHLIQIQQPPHNSTLAYTVETEEARFDGPREAGRADTARVMVGILLDIRRPAPLPDDSPTVYSHLPTAEHTGLRFFIQAPFDVPVDRERITYDSAWNLWLLSRVPSVWRALIARVLQQTLPQHKKLAGHSLLNVLPLQAELGAPIYKIITDGLPAALADAAFLPCRGDKMERAASVVIVSPTLAFLEDGAFNARFLEGQQDSPQLPPRSVFVPPTQHGKRAEEVAVALGALRLDERTLIDRLEAALKNLPNGSKPPGDWLPACVRTPDPDGFTHLLKTFERALTSPHAAPDLLERLQKLPILMDDSGQLWRAVSEQNQNQEQEQTLPMGHGTAPHRALYQGTRPLLHANLDPSLNPKTIPRDARTTLERLGVVHLTPTVLADIAAQRFTQYPRLYNYLGQITDALKTAEIHRFLELPIYRDTRGGLGPLALPTPSPAPIVSPCEPSLRALLDRAGFKLLDAAAQESLAPLIEAAHLEMAGIGALIECFVTSPPAPDDLEHLQKIHEALTKHFDEIAQDARLGEMLPTLKIWPTVGDQVLSAKDLIDAQPLLDLLPDCPARIELNARLLHPSARVNFDALTPWVSVQPALEALVALIHQSARDHAPLADQPIFLSNETKLRAVLQWLLANGEPPAPQPKNPTAQTARGKKKPLDTEITKPPTSWPLLNARGCVRLVSLRAASPTATAALMGMAVAMDLLHPSFQDLASPLRLEVFSPFDVLATLYPDAATLTLPPGLSDPTTRAAFCAALYVWLEEDAPAIFADPRCVALLRRLPVFLSRGGRLLAAPDLIIDAELSALGLDLDGQPHADISPALRVLLTKHLDAGNPPLRALVERHLIPAYTQLLTSDLPDADKKNLAARLLGYISQRIKQEPRALDNFNLGAHILVEAADGTLKPPNELFRQTDAIESLLGDVPHRYIAPALADTLGEPLQRTLGLLGADHIHLADLCDHIDARIAAKQPIPQRLYQWIEQKLAAKKLDGPTLTKTFGERAWLCTDDGVCFTPSRVLACTARRLFGERRGYWEDGARRCPNVRAVLNLPTEATPEVISDFLKDISDDVTRLGDTILLSNEPALPRMMLACYAALGRARYTLRRDLPIILCRAPHTDALRLLPAHTAGLVRDDAPELARILASTGRLWIAHPGDVGDTDDRDAIDDLYTFSQIPKLRAACEVSVEVPLRGDITHNYTDAIALLRRTIGALCSALARVRRHPTYKLQKEAWRVDTKLLPLSERAQIRVIDPLSVRYTLRGVGDATQPTSAIYSPQTQTLWLNTAAVTAPQQQAIELALALAPCIYEGPEQSQLLDMLTLLLSQGRGDAMHALLDRRHFPASDAQTPRPWLLDRLCDLRDYGLLRRLMQQFPILTPNIIRPWTERATIDPIQAAAGPVPNPESAAKAAASLLPPSSPDDLQKILTNCLAAPTLDAISLPALQNTDTDTDFAPPTNTNTTNTHHPKPPTNPDTPENTDWLNSLFEHANLPSPPPKPPQPQAPQQTHTQQQPPPLPATKTPSSKTPLPPPQQTPPQITTNAPARDFLPAPVRSGPGFWGRIANWLGFSSPALPPEPPPDWAADAAQSFSAPDHIPNQLWTSGEALRTLNQRPSRFGLSFTPPRLDAPHIYAVRTIGEAFDADTQSWRAPKTTLRLDVQCEGLPIERFVRFQGTLPASEARLPLPMYSKLTAPPQTTEGVLLPLRFGAQGLPLMQLAKETAVRFEVSLLAAPVPNDLPDPSTEPALTSVAPGDFPKLLRAWIKDQMHQPAWAKALGAEQFIRNHYTYDLDFSSHPGVQKARTKLKQGRGNHHITLLHASGDNSTLGRGVCYELNTLLVEILRHLGIASWVATGWTLKDGWASRPSHLFALALLPTPDGLRIVPLDASTAEGSPRPPLSDTPPPPSQCPHCGFSLAA